MTTTPEKCPACDGIGYRLTHGNYGQSRMCDLCCNGTLSPDDWWRETDPTRLVAMLGDNPGAETERLVGIVFSPDHAVCGVIRCTYLNPLTPRERVECDATLCDNGKILYGINQRTNCPRCQGSGTIPAPRIDPRWLTASVCDLVRSAIRPLGKWEVVPDDDYTMYRVRWSIPDEQGRYQWVRHYPEHLRHAAYREAEDFNSGERFPNFNGPLPEQKPNYAILPILADALMDAGCDDEEMIAHFRDGPHVDGQCAYLGLLVEAMR